MKNNTPSKSSMPTQVIMGIMVVALGLLFLLDNLDIWDFHRAIQFWPLALIALGLVKLVDTKSPNGYLLGSVLIGVGVLMLLNRLGYIDFSWRTLWPLVLIAIGGSVIFRALTGRRVLNAPNLKAEDDNDSVIDVTAILGGFERRITTQHFRGGEVTAFMGGCGLDLRDASIDGEAVINVFAVMGGITLKCPPDWTVQIYGTPIMGGFEEKTIVPKDSSKRLIVKGYAIMGGVEVRN